MSQIDAQQQRQQEVERANWLQSRPDVRKAKEHPENGEVVLEIIMSAAGETEQHVILLIMLRFR